MLLENLVKKEMGVKLESEKTDAMLDENKIQTAVNDMIVHQNQLINNHLKKSMLV